MTALEIRLALYGLLLAAIGGWLIYERAHLIGEGEARVKAADTAAASRQKQEDARLSGATIDDLQKQLTALATRPVAVTPPPRMRMCIPTSVVRAESPAGRAQPGELAQPAVDRGLLPRDSSGSVRETGDIGPGVQALRDAGRVLAVYHGVTYEWALKQSQPVSGQR